jgi:DNA-binding GntR family transcriptional regulator
MSRRSKNDGSAIFGQDQTAQERAYWFIREALLDQRLKPGKNLNDGEIASLLGTSRTPVREALRRLEHDGLVVNLPRRGWSVPLLTVDDIVQIFEIKETLEGMVARRAVERMTPTLQAELELAILDMEKAAANGDRDAWMAADMHWHDALFSASGNERAREIIGMLNAQWYSVRVGLVALEGRMGKSIGEHQAVLERILERDGEGAEALMQDHLSHVKKYLLDLVTNLVLPLSQTLQTSRS